MDVPVVQRVDLDSMQGKLYNYESNCQAVSPNPKSKVLKIWLTSPKSEVLKIWTLADNKIKLGHHHHNSNPKYEVKYRAGQNLFMTCSLNNH